MAKLTKHGTSVSIGIDLTEILREFKAQNPSYTYISMSRLIQILIAERLTELQTKKTGLDYVQHLGLLG